MTTATNTVNLEKYWQPSEIIVDKDSTLNIKTEEKIIINYE